MIPVALYLSTELLIDLKNLNQRLSFLLFSEQMQAKFLHLISFVLYSGAVLLPFRKAFLQYGTVNSELPAVLFAAFSLVVVVVLLLFFNREDLIRILPSQGYFFGWLKRKIELYYYPVFLFFMGLLILSNPYVGYVRLAWFLAFAFPTSLLFVMSCIFAHHYIRKFSLYFFMKDNEEDMVVRFENAKMYYGFFVVLSFIFVSLIGFLFIARIWGFAYTIPTLYKALSEDWVLKLADGGKLGFIEFLMAICFILTSFIASSLFQKYLLNRLFDIFRTEPGAQNTIVRMSHYLVVLVVLIIGFVAIGLSAYIKYLLTLLVIGVSLGLKDQIADFFAGLLVLLERQIEIGHYIQADNVQGTVEKIEARSTTIRTARNFSVIIPNRDLISKTIINWGRGRSSVGFELSLHVNFDTDPEKVKNALLEVIQAHPMVLRMPSVVVRLEDFDTLGQLFFVRAFISSRKLREQWEIASELRIAIIKAFQKINVQIPYPTNTLDISLPMVSKGGISVKFDQQE
jgi:small-conductance mechanosensitive channel